MLLYPLAMVQMYHQAKYGKVPYCAGETPELGSENPAANDMEMCPPYPAINMEKSPPYPYETKADIQKAEVRAENTML